MKCQFINLENATTRRVAIQKSFSKFNSQEWMLSRFSAIDVNYVIEHNIPGNLSNEEKACFLSHKSVIKENLDSSEAVWIFEDDVEFAENTFELIEAALNSEMLNLEWDILFTDVGIPVIGLMSELVILRRALMEKKKIDFLSLNGCPFFGATSYIINERSLRKIYNLINEVSLDIPIDLLYRKLAYEGRLNAFVTFPFLTTDSEESHVSQIQKDHTSHVNLTLSLFRKLVWLEGDNFDPTFLLNQILKGLDKKSLFYAGLWAVMADPTWGRPQE